MDKIILYTEMWNICVKTPTSVHHSNYSNNFYPQHNVNDSNSNNNLKLNGYLNQKIATKHIQQYS